MSHPGITNLRIRSHQFVTLFLLVAAVLRVEARAQVDVPSTETACGSVAESDMNRGFTVVEKADRLLIAFAKQPLAEFVYQDPKILRPYFAQVRTLTGLPVTRNHPPMEGTDATDHDAMHPGLWLGFGDLSGHDFWRNKGRIEHLRFTEPPTAKENRLTFSTASRLLTPTGGEVCQLSNRFILEQSTSGWMLIWEATFRSDQGDFTFGDQEEMGFGARVATPLTEKNGGVILSSTGRKTAAATWGQPANWCDYSGSIGDRRSGITLMAGPANFRESWWHNRDYGVFVANPFGRAAMMQGAKSSLTVKKGETFRIRFASVMHDASDYDPAAAFKRFTEIVR